ncbi:MAG: hypothetical protein ACOYYS_17745 [Chloroflexota bacterium]
MAWEMFATGWPAAATGAWTLHTLALAGNLFGAGLIAGWLLAWFVLAATQPKTPTEE